MKKRILALALTAVMALALQPAEAQILKAKAMRQAVRLPREKFPQ